jgi:hypothetical protein
MYDDLGVPLPTKVVVRHRLHLKASRIVYRAENTIPPDLDTTVIHCYDYCECADDIHSLS